MIYLLTCFGIFTLLLFFVWIYTIKIALNWIWALRHFTKEILIWRAEVFLWSAPFTLYYCFILAYHSYWAVVRFTRAKVLYLASLSVITETLVHGEMHINPSCKHSMLCWCLNISHTGVNWHHIGLCGNHIFNIGQVPLYFGVKWTVNINCPCFLVALIGSHYFERCYETSFYRTAHMERFLTNRAFKKLLIYFQLWQGDHRFLLKLTEATIYTFVLGCEQLIG